MTSKLKARPPEEVSPGHAKGLLFGESGAGKTWFALQFPAPYYIDTEGGARLKHYMERLKASGGAYLGPDDGACDFDAVAEQIKALTTESHPYKTLVIDSVSKVFQSKIAIESDKLGDADVYGASKKPAVKAMRRLMMLCERIDMNVWLIAREAAKWEGAGKERTQAGVMPDVWDQVTYELDLTLQIKKHSKGLRTASVYKTRLKGFPDFERFDLQKGEADVGYANFSERYGKDFIEAAVVPLVLASVEQVAEIVRLLDVVKVDPAELERLLTKAKAESFADLTEDQADKMTAWLTKKVGKNGAN